MPTYEYHCEKCGKNFDVFQSMRDQAFTECPKDHCQLPEWGHGKVKRLLGTGAGVIFKGSGFYITDYRSNSYKEAAKKDAPPSSSGGEKKESAAPAPSTTPPKSAETKPKSSE
ncbi:MAG TPA: FmdB family zinc ribbon protein [Chthoniobacterales bacterium]|jgi:putative FmdB family regulatory protein